MSKNVKIEIQKLNSNPADTMLECYEHKEHRPLCKIYEEDFVELLTDNQLSNFEKGKIRFDVNRMELLVKSKQWFGR